MLNLKVFDVFLTWKIKQSKSKINDSIMDCKIESKMTWGGAVVFMS